MNDLLDRRLKKMNHNVKYKRVSFKEKDIQRMVRRTKQKSARSSKSWMKLALPIPIVTLLAAMVLLYFNTPSRTPMYTAATLEDKQVTTSLKSVPIFDKSDINQTKAFDRGASTEAETSTIIQETYVIHNGERYVQTGQVVKASQLDQVIGTVTENQSKVQKPANTPPNLFPKAKIYSIEGKEASKYIAIQSRHNIGIGTSSVSKQGIFIFEKQKQLAKSQ